MADLKLTTKRELGVPSFPPQNGTPDEYFGEQSNDIQLSSINDFETVSGLEKLKQDINKVLLTEFGANTLFPLYGSQLQGMIGNKNDINVIKATIKDTVIGALQVLAYVNQANPNQDEIPATLQLLQIDVLDTLTVQITLSVITQSNKSISTGLTVNIPNA